MIMAKNVAKAVKLTDKAVFPFARCVKKLEMLPPGQAATIIIPNAIVGCGLIISTSKKVKAGNRKNWDRIPTKTGLGCLSNCLKSFKVMFNATPNMTTAKAIFNTHRPLLSKLITTLSSSCIIKRLQNH